jgi:hypothetical protein
MDFFSHKAVVAEIQEKNFDGHPILFCDAESKVIETNKLLEDLVWKFNEYLATREALFKSESGPEARADRVPAILSGAKRHLAIDIEFLRLRAEEFLVDYTAKPISGSRRLRMMRGQTSFKKPGSTKGTYGKRFGNV